MEKQSTDSLQALLQRVRNTPARVEFDEVMNTIAALYDYHPTRFSNGIGDDRVENPAGTNEGSCKVFAFARMHGLDDDQTLACFGHYYRDHVLDNPDGLDHANIRTFMRHGQAGVSFDSAPLTPRA